MGSNPDTPGSSGGSPRAARGASPLFDRHPGLAARLPWRPIGSFPTPVEELPSPSEHVRLFVKRDDLSSSLYGGNKVRKLEHLLGSAVRQERGAIVTLGGLGSNHALATALHGRECGMRVELALYDQPVTPLVRRTMAAFLHAGAKVRYGGSLGGAFLEARKAFVQLRKEGHDPAFIMVGGTSPLGCIGHVSAALELAGQVREGLLPVPGRLYVPLGTCGTAAGLIVGLRLAGLPTRVTAVRVADPLAANARVLHRLAQHVANRLRAMDSGVPQLRIGRGDFDVLTDYIGRGYGLATPASLEAVEWAAPRLALETTYSGKALAAALHYCRTATAPENVLFWNSYNSAPVTTAMDRAELPVALRHLADEPID